jgi:hypothetical protein
VKPQARYAGQSGQLGPHSAPEVSLCIAPTAGAAEASTGWFWSFEKSGFH